VIGVLTGVVVVLGAFGGVHLYLWKRLVSDVSAPGGWYRRIGTALAVVLPLVSLGALVGGRTMPISAERWLAWPGYLWLAVVLYLTMALLVGEVLRPLLRRALTRRAVTGRAVTRRAIEPEVPEVMVADELPAVVAAGELPAVVAAGEPPTDVAAGGGGGVPAAPDADGAVCTPAPSSGRHDGPHPGRRMIIARSVAVAATAAATATVGRGMYGVLRGPRLKGVTVPLARLSVRTDGYRVAVVSDIHLGPILGRAHTERIVRTINDAQPDLIAIVGDLVDGSVADLGPAVEPLARLRARHGSFFVTGNHEYFSGADAWVDHIRELGVHPLENARVELPGFDLAGVNDVTGANHGEPPDFDRALGDRDRDRASVLLAHQPVQIGQAVRFGVDLQLSGHTHGGQLWPGNFVAGLANPTVAGLKRYGDTQLYVTRGAGAWGPPVRVGAPSDITIVTLRSAHA
jgi:uncharacterized protein